LPIRRKNACDPNWFSHVVVKESNMNAPGDLLLLGIDGGGTRCRARLCTAAGDKLGEGSGGPANLRLGVEQSFASVLEATTRCMSAAGLSPRDLKRVVACLALAGASEPNLLDAARRHRHPYRAAVVVTDAQAACAGAHGGRDGGIIVIGTGTIGWAERGGRHYRVGGWGWPISDEASGAWLGCEALRRTLWAHDGRIPWTGLLTALFKRFRSNPHAIVRWMTSALPRDFASLAPAIIEHAAAGDPVARELMQLAGGHVDALAQRLLAFGVDRLALVGGLAASIESWVAEATRSHLVAPLDDALAGALQLAGDAAQSGSHRDFAAPRRRR
jgi:glucosamine kinase